MKQIIINILESGKSALVLDPEHEYAELAANLGGTFIDLMSGEFIINPLEPKNWDGDSGVSDEAEPTAFRQSTKLSQHISFLKDFFKSYKDFQDRHIDALEIMLQKLYESRNITDRSNFARLRADDFPTLSDLYALIESELENVGGSEIYSADLLRELLLGLHSMCVGAESRFFNGHTNVASSRFVVFGVKGLLQASGNVRNALLFNVLSYMSDRLLNEGSAAASIDELYLFLSNPTAIEYIRGFMKRVRKKDSAVVIASQNLEDFNVEGIRELTKPLFSIPTHAFLFNAGNIDKRFYMDSLQLEESEYNLIRYPQRGVCLYKCGNERYNLAVEAPPYKARLFGSAGGK
jgi:type IV secretory pathway VirB4 component